MLGGYIHNPDKNKCRIKNSMSSGDRKAYVRRPPSEEFTKHVKERYEQASNLLIKGISRQEAYEILKEKGALTFKGNTLVFMSFNNICVEICKNNHKIPKRQSNSELIRRMLSANVTKKDIAKKLEIPIGRVHSVISADKNKRKDNGIY